MVHEILSFVKKDVDLAVINLLKADWLLSIKRVGAQTIQDIVNHAALESFFWTASSFKWANYNSKEGKTIKQTEWLWLKTKVFYWIIKQASHDSKYQKQLELPIGNWINGL
jgi:hypothetical protein